MITFWNRKEVLICNSQKECDAACALLDAHQISYIVRVRSRNSPSVFSVGVRERSGTFMQSTIGTYMYYIYVKRDDYEYAKRCMHPQRK